MRVLGLPLLAFLLTVPVLAGCISDDSGDAADDGAAALGAIAESTPPVLDGVDLVAKIQTFSEAYPKRNANNENHNAARDYLAGEMEALGYEVLRQTFQSSVSPTSTPSNLATRDGTLQNVIGVKWGTDASSWVVIGGHYDVTDGAVYGAYDDGSGTIMTLELARAFKDIETEKTIAFFMFDGEEQGLRGSSHFVETLSDGSFEEEFGYAPDIFSMIDLDMFGINFPAEPPIYFDDNSDAVRNFVDESRQAIGIPDDKFKFTGITLGRSDYAPFEDAGIPIAFFISAFEEIYAGPVALPQGTSYPFWHQADTVEGMELMAGNRDLLEQGFTVAARLSSELLHWLSTTPDLELDVRA